MSEMIESSLSAVGRRLYDRLRPRWALSGPREGYPRFARARAEGGPRVAVGRTRTVIAKKEAALRRP
jgi:hypothetical protein